MANNAASQTAAGARATTDRAAAREAMLSTLERVLLLKRVPLFHRTPDSSLADVADAMSEIVLPAGEPFMREGELGESLYVVADGSVMLDHGNQALDTLGPGDVAGELAVLDPGPREYTATAVTSTRLLALHRDLLFELMGERLEVAHGIVEFLIRRYARKTPAASAGSAGDALASTTGALPAEPGTSQALSAAVTAR